MKKYELVCEGLYDNFNKEVNRLLEDGWELYGSPFAGHYSGDEGMDYSFCQSLIKNTID